jgi:hypothetical protein
MRPETFKVQVLGFNSHREAEEFSEWYSGQGEQDFAGWLEESEIDLDTADTKQIESKDYGIRIPVIPTY